jgi:hypothetical protein
MASALLLWLAAVAHLDTGNSSGTKLGLMSDAKDLANPRGDTGLGADLAIALLRIVEYHMAL